ncbi:MAG TPA: hypothetical protein PKV80_27345 [Leptospiraceae bacterium]|nr:hypothetical protein [Leptospiraceae bacterium]
MGTEIRDNRINLDRLISDLSAVSGKSEIVGIITDDEQMKIIAAANEFGAEIHSPKALKFMRVLAGKNKVKLTGDGKGFIRIPERSYLRSAADDRQNQDGIAETVRFYAFRALAGISTFDEILSRAGNYLAKKIQGRIASQTPPKNHPLTEAIKGHDKTLIGQTKKLISSIDHKTVGRNEIS